MALVIILAIFAVAFGAMLIWLGSNFPEQWRATSRDAFGCQLPAGVVVQRLLACAGAQRGWRVDAVDAGSIRIRAATTLYAWRKRIEVVVQPTTELTSAVTIVSSSPQVYDWGDNRRAVATLRASVADAIWPG